MDIIGFVSIEKMSVARVVFFWVFACSLSLLLITATIGCEINALLIYKYGFDKYEISQATGIDRSELTRIARHLINYFNSDEESAQIVVSGEEREFNLFNERELIHLQDVRSLIRLDYWMQGIALLFVVISSLTLLVAAKTGLKEFVKALFWGSVITLGVMTFLALWALVGFEKLFILFHQVSFSNEYWILDPSNDYLIRLFPGGFFFDAALLWFGLVILETLLIGGIAWGMLKYINGVTSLNGNSRRNAG